ncbi:MAG: DNA-3-methyladenine glycosylase 2 family protein [Actinomycetota bacterium]|nr:DNA-3-methyladenine glycosylase 2 family protein [Actinomycetota bacterium]
MDAAAARWARATEAIAERDPAMAAVIARVGPCTLAPRRTKGGFFAALARSILYQQLAGRAAAAIHARFAALYGGRPTPEAVLATTDEALRGAGVSAAKAASIKDLAAKVLEGTVRLDGLSPLDDEAILERLVTVRGIGRWTGEMFLIFQLNRPDVWPVGDLGVRTGFARVHGLATVPAPRELALLGEIYRPYRTVAAWYCWRAVDAGGV